MGQQNNQPQDGQRQNAPGYNEQDMDKKRSTTEQDQTVRKVGTNDDQKREPQRTQEDTQR